VAEAAKLYLAVSNTMSTNALATEAPVSQQDCALLETGPSWYAAYTYANHEKKAAAEISRRGMESFLPVYRTMRRWSDRRVELELPLFPSYVFVRMEMRDRLNLLQVPGVAWLVGFGGTPAALPGEDIEGLRTRLRGQLRADPHPFLTAGRRVCVKCGPLAGLQGILVRRKGKFRLVVSIELIKRAMAVDVDAADVEPLP
jgi:transcription antitermination factor NusG